jgi:zinc protease
VGNRPERQVIDGVPVYWAEAPPPFTAALLFRVGRADEELPRLGLSHLVEHLAFYPIGPLTFTANGFVGDLWSAFYSSGEQEDVLGLLHDLCRNVSSLPLERLETEKRVLTTATREEVAGWASERFVKGNVVAWMTGKPPSQVTFDLPPGGRSEVPPSEPRPRLDLPAHLADGSGGVSLGAVGERASALSAGFWVIERRAENRLRRELGLSYNVTGIYEPLGANTAHLALGADCLDEHAATVQRELLEILDAIAARGPTAAELEERRDELARAAKDPTTAAGWMDYAARDELLGAEVLTPEDVRAWADALTPDEISTAFSACLSELIMVAPTGTRRPPSLTSYGERSPDPVQGASYREGKTSRTVAGKTGVSYYRADEAPVTVLFSECVAVLRWNDLRLTILAEDGSWIEIAARYMRNGAELVRLVLERLPSSIVIPMEDVQTSGSLLDLYVEKLRGINRPREFAALQEKLHPGERLEDLAALRGLTRRGLLALTDRRLLTLWRMTRAREVSTEELPLSDLKGAEVGPRAPWLLRRVVINTKAGRVVKFGRLAPRRRAADFRERLAAIARGEDA